MGFEQLAALKRELTERARQERQEKQKGAKAGARRQGAGRAASRKTEPVEPVVLAISRLQNRFPVAFPKKPAPKVPLKLGIHKELHARAETLKLTPEEITEAVKTWCQGSRYWACMVQDAPRIGLEGEPAGTVTAGEAQFAKKLAARQRANAARLRKASRPPAATHAPETPEASQAASAPETPAAPETSVPPGTLEPSAQPDEGSQAG